MVVGAAGGRGALELGQQNNVHGYVIDGSDFLNGQLIGENAADEIGQVTAASQKCQKDLHAGTKEGKKKRRP
jgi:hypothetical protein